MIPRSTGKKSDPPVLHPLPAAHGSNLFRRVGPLGAQAPRRDGLGGAGTGIITVPRSKHGEARRVPMNDTVRDILRSRPSRLKSAYVFPSGTGETPLDARNYMNRIFNKALKRAKVENFTWHCLRHTFASRLVMKRVDLRTVQELMGHKTMAMTLRYSHLSPGHQLEAVQRLNPAPTDTRTDTVAQPVQAFAGPKAEIVDGPWASERARPDSNGGPAGSKPVRGGGAIAAWIHGNLRSPAPLREIAASPSFD
jgi:hypothetical protein